MKIEIVTPEKTAYSEEADKVTLSTFDGQITILGGHVPIVTKLVPGELILTRDSKRTVLATGGGFAEVSGKGIRVATDLANRPEEINEKVVEEARKRAEEALKDKERLSEEEYALTAATLERALAQLKVRRKHAHGHRAPETIL